MRKTGVYSKIPGRWTDRELVEAYYWDRLDAAYEGILRNGMGYDGSRSHLFRRVEAEYITRQSSELLPINDWLTLEYLPNEVADPNAIGQAVFAACDEIAKRLSWQHGGKVLVTILANDTDASWLPGRFGVFLDKYPYDKICIPLWATQDPAHLHAVIIHEYAHEIVLELTQGRAPRWLNEMVAKVAEGGPRRDIAQQFASGKLVWLDARRLDLQYVEEAEGHPRNLANAYEQSACIGAYLVSLKGERHLATLLKAFNQHSVLTELIMRALNQRPSDKAFRQAYEMKEREVFARALDWLKESLS